MTVNSPAGISTRTSFRLFCLAPTIRNLSAGSPEPEPLFFPDRAAGRRFPPISPESAIPVALPSRANCSGVPQLRTLPPWAPPAGPRSMTWSACFTTSRQCSMITTVLPLSTRACRQPSRLSISAKCKPVVGSSSRYSVLPVLFFRNSVASLTR